MTQNTSKTKQMAMSLRNKMTLETQVCVKNKVIERVDSFKLVGVNIDEHLTFHKHAESIVERSHVKVHALQLLKRYGVNQSGLCRYYMTIIRPLLTYACQAWFPSLARYDILKLESIQRRCLKLIFPHIEHYDERLIVAKLPALEVFMSNLCSDYSANVINNPIHRLSHLIPSRQDTNRHSTRTHNTLIKKHRTQSLMNTIFYKFGI